jgi:hypothetical protein
VYSGRNWLTFQRCFLPPSSGRPDGGSKHLCNVGQFLRDYTVQYPRRQSFFSCSRENLKSHEVNPDWQGKRRTTNQDWNARACAGTSLIFLFYWCDTWLVSGKSCSTWRWVMQFLPGAGKWHLCSGLSVNALHLKPCDTVQEVPNLRMGCVPNFLSWVICSALETSVHVVIPVSVASTTVRRSGSVHVGRLVVSADVRRSGTPCTWYLPQQCFPNCASRLPGEARNYVRGGVKKLEKNEKKN